MERSQDQTATFMMLCIGDFANKLWIPTKFVRKYSEISEQKSVMLKTDSDKTWDVKIKRINEDLYMEEGWSEFVKDNELTDFDFLTFRLLRLRGSLSFKVSVYGADGCPKRPAAPSSTSDDDDDDYDDEDDEKHEIIKARDEKLRKRRVLSRGRGRPPKIKLHGTNVSVKRGQSKGTSDDDDDDNDDDDDEYDEKHEIIKGRDEKVRKRRVLISRGRGRPPKIKLQGINMSMKRGQSKARNDVVSVGSSNNNPLYLEICLKHIQRSRIILPARFSKACGLIERKYVKMEFVATGYCKNVALNHLLYRTDLAAGWSDFRRATKIVVGKTYSFKYSPKQNVIRVKEVKKRSL